MPAEWWGPEPQPGDAGTLIGGRIMWADLGLAWLGQWGYLGALVWIPVAIVRATRRIRGGAVVAPLERILFVALCGLLLTITALVHLTPLRYSHYNFFVF